MTYSTGEKYLRDKTLAFSDSKNKKVAIVILTLQPILKLPPLLNVNYLGLSYPIILQIL